MFWWCTSVTTRCMEGFNSRSHPEICHCLATSQDLQSIFPALEFPSTQQGCRADHPIPALLQGPRESRDPMWLGGASEQEGKQPVTGRTQEHRRWKQDRVIETWVPNVEGLFVHSRADFGCAVPGHSLTHWWSGGSRKVLTASFPLKECKWSGPPQWPCLQAESLNSASC